MYFKYIAGILLLTVFIRAGAQTVFPVSISSNHRYLVDANNKPFPILGRTAWFIISQPENNYKEFIANTLEHGHNAIEMSVITHWPIGNHAPFNGRGDMPFTKRLDGSTWDGSLLFTDIKTQGPDLLSPNKKYWQYVDTFLSYCEEKGILVFMFPGYVGYAGGDQGWMRELVANGVQKTEAYGAWVANRYKKQKNIVWMLLGDFSAFNEEQKLAEAALIKGLKSVQGQSMQYSAESQSGENAAEHPVFGREMTLNGSYTWELRTPVPMVARRAYAHSPAIPAFLLEEPYDEEGPDGNGYNPNAIQPVRRFQWWGWLSTCGGYISGNGYVWQFISPIWQQHLNTRAAIDMARLNAFVRSIEWWKLVPSGLNGMKTLVTDKNNPDTLPSYVAAAADPKGSLLVAYIPPAHSGSITIDMTAMQATTYASWFDPTAGLYIPASIAPVSNTNQHTFTPPTANAAGEKDWVLLLTTQEGIFYQ